MMKIKNAQISSLLCYCNNNFLASDDTDSLSSRGPSFTSENYDGDVSDMINSAERSLQEENNGDTALLINN